MYGRIVAANVSMIENSRKRCTHMLDFLGSSCHFGTMCIAGGHFLGSCTYQIISGLSKVLRMSGRYLLPKLMYIPDLYLALSYEPYVFCCASLCCLSLKSIFCKLTTACPFLRVLGKIKRGHRYESSIASP